MSEEAQEEKVAGNVYNLAEGIDGVLLETLTIELLPDKEDLENIYVVVTFGQKVEGNQSYAFTLDNARILAEGLFNACLQAETIGHMLRAQSAMAREREEGTGDG